MSESSLAGVGFAGAGGGAGGFGGLAALATIDADGFGAVRAALRAGVTGL
jgi:hypothetical protein